MGERKPRTIFEMSFRIADPLILKEPKIKKNKPERRLKK